MVAQNTGRYGRAWCGQLAKQAKYAGNRPGSGQARCCRRHRWEAWWGNRGENGRQVGGRPAAKKAAVGKQKMWAERVVNAR